MNPMLERRLPQFCVGFCSEVVDPGVMATMSVRLERPGVVESLMIPDYLVPQERFSLRWELPSTRGWQKAGSIDGHPISIGGGTEAREIVGGLLHVRTLRLTDLPHGTVMVRALDVLHMTLTNVTKEPRRLVGSVWLQELPENFLGQSMWNGPCCGGGSQDGD